MKKNMGLLAVSAVILLCAVCFIVLEISLGNV